MSSKNESDHLAVGSSWAHRPADKLAPGDPNQQLRESSDSVFGLSEDDFQSQAKTTIEASSHRHHDADRTVEIVLIRRNRAFQEGELEESPKQEFVLRWRFEGLELSLYTFVQ